VPLVKATTMNPLLVLGSQSIFSFIAFYVPLLVVTHVVMIYWLATRRSNARI
jgi:hypothetical protein